MIQEPKIDGTVSSPITIINVALIAGISSLIVSFVAVFRSYRHGYKRGNRGKALLIYPLKMCHRYITCANTPERQDNRETIPLGERRGSGDGEALRFEGSNDETLRFEESDDDEPPPHYTPHRIP